MTKVGYTTIHPNLTPFVAKVIRLLAGDLWRGCCVDFAVNESTSMMFL